MQTYKMGQRRGWPGGESAAVGTEGAGFKTGWQRKKLENKKLGAHKLENPYKKLVVRNSRKNIALRERKVLRTFHLANQTAYDVSVTCTDSTAAVRFSGTDASEAGRRPHCARKPTAYTTEVIDAKGINTLEMMCRCYIFNCSAYF